MADSEAQKLDTMGKSRDLHSILERSTTPQVSQHHSLGHKRDFNPLEIIALGFNVSNSWVAIAVSFAVVVAAGGPVTLVYGVIVACVMYTAVAISLAELASVYPTAGGQYHFTSLVAPKAISRGASYVCGMIAAFSWVALCTAATIIAAQLLLALPAYFVSTYIPQAWHYFVIYQAINIVVLIYNLLVLKRTPWVHNIGCESSIHPGFQRC